MAVLLLAGCSGCEEPEAATPNEGASEAGVALAEFAGSRVKAVWVQQQKDGGLDQHAAGKSFKVMAFDSASGGERVLVGKTGSYARPLLTPDGSRVVFSTKGANKDASGTRSYRPRCFVIDFEGGEAKDLGKGYAEFVWQDPADGTVWVYAGIDYADADSVVMEGARLERFKLETPETRELVWGKTTVGNEGFGLSRDGKRLVGLFPWPNAGVADLATGELTRTGSGCWTAMAPGDSGVTWVFDGAHRNVTFYAGDGGEISTVALNAHPDLRGHKVYHPRWTNHPHFAVMSGPYLGNKKAGANKVEIYLAKFSPDLTAVERTLPITSNGRADLFPDVWIEDRGEASLGAIASTDVAGSSGAWPRVREGLVFAWEKVSENVEVDGEVCRVRAEGAARYGRRFGMAPGHGTFVVDELADDTFSGVEALSFGAVVTPAETDGAVMQIGSWLLEQESGQFVMSQRSGEEGELHARFGKLVPGRPVTVAIRWSNGHIDALIDGKPGGLRTEVVNRKRPRLSSGVRFGGGWDGRLEQVAIYRGGGGDLAELSGDRIAPTVEELEVAGRAKARLKLVEMTELPTPNELGAYTRGLVYFLYDVVEVLDGELAAERVAVAHWCLLDRKPAAGLPVRIGEEVVLVIDLFDQHPELKSERRVNTLSDFDAQIYFDTRTPQLKE